MLQDLASIETETVLPSLEAEAATAAALFLIQRNPDLCREFFHHMMGLGEQRKVSTKRVRAGYHQWAQWMRRSLDITGTPVSLPETSAPKAVVPETTDPLEKLLLSSAPVTPEPDFKKEEWEAIEADLMIGVEEDRARRKEEQAFIFHMCTEADRCLVDLSETKGRGLSALARRPTIVVSGRRRAILVQSFTVPFNGAIVRRDFKANLKPVVVRHPNMFVQADGQKLIRSKVTEAKRHEFYVKGLEYVEGMILKAYIEAGRRDREDLAAYYQVRMGEIVDLSEKDYRLAENLIAAGKDPATLYRFDESCLESV